MGLVNKNNQTQKQHHTNKRHIFYVTSILCRVQRKEINSENWSAGHDNACQ